jgi:hypothetical protein
MLLVQGAKEDKTFDRPLIDSLAHFPPAACKEIPGKCMEERSPGSIIVNGTVSPDIILYCRNMVLQRIAISGLWSE